ncbi:MAG: serine acetyltransferase [Verrucomicrobia bacterium]|nr:serine acetyltransferase [Verrucomicrobiota bacterium]
MNSRVNELADELVASYARVGGINHLDGKNLPSKTAMAGITLDLLRLLFPGFFDERVLHSSELRPQVDRLLTSVAERLETEIGKALEYSVADATTKRKLRAIRRELTLEFLGCLPRVRELLQTDMEAAYQGDPAALSREEIIVAYPCIEAIAVQRLAHQLFHRRVPLIPRIMTEWAHFRTGIDLHPGAWLGTHFFIDHGTGTVVGETTEIGDHVKIYHGVTLGAKSTADVETLRGRKRHPTIRDHVTIYPGATILGGDTVIGAHSTIGGNVFLTTSVPAYSLAIIEGISVKVLKKRDRLLDPNV